MLKQFGKEFMKNIRIHEIKHGDVTRFHINYRCNHFQKIAEEFLEKNGFENVLNWEEFVQPTIDDIVRNSREE